MNKSYIFHLEKVVWSMRGPTFIKKRIEYWASDSVRAIERVKEQFPDWVISMFWPKWPQ